MDRSFEPWTPEEEEKLAKIYRRYGAKYASRELGRSIRAVVGRAWELKLGPPKRRWTEEEDNYLRRHYGDSTAIEIAKDLDRTEQSVRARVHLFGLGEATGRNWTDEEIRYLRRNYRKSGAHRIAEELGRTYPSVEVKAARLGLSRQMRHPAPNARESKEIVRLLGTMPMTELAERYSTSLHYIEQIAREQGYRERPTSRAWTAGDDDDLRELYGTASHEEVARRLDRTVVAIKWRAGRLGLTRPTNRGEQKPWSNKEVARLRLLARTMNTEEIAAKLGRTKISVHGKLESLGLKAVPKKRTRRTS